VWAECRVCTSQETQYALAANPNRLMLFGETVAVYCENHTEHTNIFCGQNVEFWYVKAGGTYITTGLYRLKAQECILGVHV
jgi:hypothetical protein